MFTDLHLAHSGLADLLILLIFTDFAGQLPSVSLWVWSGYDLWQVRELCLAGNGGLAVQNVGKSASKSVKPEDEEEANMATSSNKQFYI